MKTNPSKKRLESLTEAMPFGGGLVDQKILVMNPDYGARLQLQKIAMLDVAEMAICPPANSAQAPSAVA